VSESVFLGAINQGVAATGTLNPKIAVDVGTQISGIIEGVFVDYNDEVVTGSLLAIVDSSIIDANIEQLTTSLSAAKAVLEVSESKFRREKKLFEKDYISIATLENTEKTLQEAKSRLALTEAELKRERRKKVFTNIRSPIDGVVMEKKVDVGQTVAASFQTPTLFKIAANLNNLQIEALVSEADIGEVSKDQKVKFYVDAFFNESFNGIVQLVRLEPKVEQGVVNYIVVISVDNKGKRLLPGMTAQATIITESKQNVVLLPVSATRFNPSKEDISDGDYKNSDFSSDDFTSVYVTNQKGMLERRKVKTGITDGKFMEVVEGLRIGEKVVTREAGGKTKKSAFSFSGR
jgi:HlyD family secretion protein